MFLKDDDAVVLMGQGESGWYEFIGGDTGVGQLRQPIKDGVCPPVSFFYNLTRRRKKRGWFMWWWRQSEKKKIARIMHRAKR